jgi:peroxiredoxin
MASSSGTWTRWVARYRQARQRRGFRWGVDLAVLLAVLAAVGAWQTRGHLSGVQAPSAVLATLDGERVSLDALRGKPVLLAFWAPWCTICAAESQNLSWARRIAGDRARVVSVAASFEDVSQVRAYVREHAVDYPVLLGDEELIRAFRVEAFPTVYVLDAGGRVRRSAVGYTTTLGLLARLLL